MTKRGSTHDDRDRFVPKHRTEPHGNRIPEPLPEDITGQYEGEELAVARSRRPTYARIARLEVRLDGVQSDVAEMRKDLGAFHGDAREALGKLDVLPDLIRAVKEASDRVQQREHVTFTAQVEVDKATELDVLDARKLRRRLALKVIGLLGAGGVVAEIAHWLIGKVS